MSTTKRISTEAYQALRDALPAILWFKPPFERYLRTALRDHSNLLAVLPFSEPKRVVADVLVDRLVANEARYRDLTLSLMLEIAAMERFPDLERIKDEPDRSTRIETATRSVEHLRTLTKQFSEQIAERERLAREQEAANIQVQKRRTFSDELTGLKVRFLGLQHETDAQSRGRAFEPLLTDLFVLFDMEPRLAYNLEREQIDGSLSFDTDDYIVEARWRAVPSSRADADVFASKVRRKGKNALGLFVSMSGLSADAIGAYEEATPFMVMDGSDLFLVLDQLVRLDELLRMKKRHANETGDCYLPAAALSL